MYALFPGNAVPARTRPQDIFFQSLLDIQHENGAWLSLAADVPPDTCLPPFARLAATVRAMAPAGIPPLDAIAHVAAWRLSWTGPADGLEAWRQSFPDPFYAKIDEWLEHMAASDAWGSRPKKIDVFREEVLHRIAQVRPPSWVPEGVSKREQRAVEVMALSQAVAHVMQRMFALPSPPSAYLVRSNNEEPYALSLSANPEWDRPL